MEDENQLLENLVDDGFCETGICAMSLLLTRLELINIELQMKLNRRVIQMKTGRMKSYESTRKKMLTKGLAPDFFVAKRELNDLVGVRAVCAYIDDIYRVKEMIARQSDIRILKEKDYIKKPKQSGYRSLHMILELPVEFDEKVHWIKIELQLRTAAMDYWANLDHQLRYKKRESEVAEIDDELQRCAGEIEQLDRRMLAIREKIEQI